MTAGQGTSLFLWRLVLVAWTVQIFWFSTARFGPEHTTSLLAGLFSFAHISVAPNVLDVMDTIARKVAHLAEYAIFSFCLYRSLGGRDRLRSQPHLPLWCIIAAAGWSLMDELHQAFVPGRTASLLDCGIDATGAAIAMLLVYASWAAQTRHEKVAAQ